MQLKTTVTKQVELDLETPSFFMKKNTDIRLEEYLGVFDENNVITLHVSPTFKMLQNTQLWVKEKDIVKAANEWEKISEADFLNAYELFLKGMSLLPTLMLDNPDDLAGVL